MFCPKCGNNVKKNSKYCNSCGNDLVKTANDNPIKSSFEQKNIASNSYQQTPYVAPYKNNYNGTNNNRMIFIGIGTGLGLLSIFILVLFLFHSGNSKYYYSTSSNNTEKNDVTSSSVNKEESTKKKGKYQTVIITDNTYSGINVSSKSDAYKLIEEDSISQKDNCPSEIKKVESEIIEKYGITAVNLCEMDVDFARELENVFDVIYKEFKGARGYITNLSLRNTSMLSEGGVIAAFMPIFNFASSSSESTYPWVIKTQVLLSSQYFLNKSRLELDVKENSSSGHFPPNTTIYSPVAHELGHYLSFLAMMKHYEINSILLIDNNNLDTFYKLYSDFTEGDYSLSMITEAYENYKKDTNSQINLDDWRGTISGYALAKNDSGDYIYDETIAEAFHDVYLNNVNAKEASKYIVNVLKKKLES